MQDAMGLLSSGKLMPAAGHLEQVKFKQIFYIRFLECQISNKLNHFEAF